MLLRVHDLVCTRGGVPVVSGVSFEVPAGEALILRGPNGSGKTTLLRVLAGVAQPAAGTIEADPESIAYAGHADGVKATLTVAENLAFWAEIYGGGDVASALRAFDLAGLADRAASALSAGQRRRLGLARLAVTGRKVWLLDEPTVSLDARNVERFAAFVTTHLDGGGAAVIATHVPLGLAGRELDLSDVTPADPVTTAADPFDEAFA